MDNTDNTDSWGGFARYLATCCGLIFVDKEYTTKSTKIYTCTSIISTRTVWPCSSLEANVLFVDSIVMYLWAQ